MSKKSGAWRWAFAVTLALLFVTIAHPAAARDYAQSATVLELGRGFDTATGEPRGRCLTNIKSNPTNDAQNATFALDKLDSVETMLSTLRISASARFKTGAWSAFANSRYLQTKEYSKTRAYFYVRILVHNISIAIDTADLTKPAKDALARGKKAFHEICGDAYVSSTTTGGEFMAIYRYEGGSESDARAFSGAIGAKFVNLLSSGSVNAEVESAFNHFQASSKLTIEVIRRGDSGSLPQKLTPEALTLFALAFPSKVTKQANPAPTSFSVGSYAELGYSVRPTGLDVDAVLVRLIKILDDDVDLFDQAQSVLSRPADYSFSNRKVVLGRLEEQKASLAKAIDDIRKIAKDECLANREKTQVSPDKCIFAMLPVTPQIEIPPKRDLVGGCSHWSEADQCLRCEFTAGQLGVSRIAQGGMSAPAVCTNMPVNVPLALRISGLSSCADRNQYNNTCGEPGVDWYVDVHLEANLDSKNEKKVSSPTQIQRGLIKNSHQVDVRAEGATTDGYASIYLSVDNIQMWPAHATGLALDSNMKFEIGVKNTAPYKMAAGYTKNVTSTQTIGPPKKK